MGWGRDWEIRAGLGAPSRNEPNPQFSNRERTVRWLSRFRRDQFRMDEFRRLLAEVDEPIHRCDDDAMLDLLAANIASRRFRLVREGFTPWTIASGNRQSSPAPQPQEPPPDAPPRPLPPHPEPVFEEPTFSAAIDTLAIAESQMEASRLGLPFCEECARKAALNALS